MEKAIEYRSLAARLRREATAVGLERVRELKLAAAARWDQLATEVEIVVAPSNSRKAMDGWIY